MTEFSPDGRALFHAYMDSGELGVAVENYRAFRYNWTELPSEEPAIVAVGGEEGTRLYVSWNGDTETVAWRFWEVLDGWSTRKLIEEVERTNFETELFVPGRRVEYVRAEATGAGGKVLRRTGVASIEPEVLPAHGLKASTAYHGGDGRQKVIGRHWNA